MRYTREEYEAITHDVSVQVNAMQRLHVFGAEPFMCDYTSCCFCPFHDEKGCSDKLDTVPGEWKTARTTEEWRRWLEDFIANNDPDRPVSVEVDGKICDTLYNLYAFKRDQMTETECGVIKKIINAYYEQTRD